MKNRNNTNDSIAVGGQAVIEGVMIRGKRSIATAIRRASGEIILKKEPFQPLSSRYPLFKLPILRGAVGIIEMLFIGMKTLNFSAEMAMQDVDPKENKTQSNITLFLTMVVAFSGAILVFFATPLFLTTRLFSIEQNAIAFNLLAGGIRLVILILYLWSISYLKDVRRLFEYHGAEHKSIFAYEVGGKLEVAEARRYPRFHPRCGTSFLFIVAFSAIIFFALFDVFLLSAIGKLTLSLRLATHLPMIPIIGGISYECIKISARYSSTIPGRIVIAPGLWLQRITTREPSDDQLEVAIAAVRASLDEEDNITNA